MVSNLRVVCDCYSQIIGGVPVEGRLDSQWVMESHSSATENDSRD
jgi:hypothetical protein